MPDHRFMKPIVIFIIAIVCSSCNAPTTDKNMDIALQTSEHPLIIRYSQKYNEIWRIDIPLKATLTNQNFLRKTLGAVNFNYNRKELYENFYHGKNNTFVKIYSKAQKRLDRNSKNKYLYYKEPKEFTLYAHTFVDTTKISQALFSRYLKEISPSNTIPDSLVLGPVEILKNSHPELIDYLNQGEVYFEFDQNNTVQPDVIRKNVAL
ncbi:hypothetical protein [Cellulophaga sp. L1A9]|uniref:hypothetical protein n=1 Tax=Cellulophaga sp. L1A9 TaxID=2686362 RepID=UPI00131C9030|nr:hypothetical protein [Cellulophaga sp. L1A9]